MLLWDPTLWCQEEAGGVSAQLNGATVLIADSSIVSRKLLGRALEGYGFEVLAVDGGVPGLEILREGGIDCLIAEAHMSDLSGLHLARAAREELALPLPIILLSAISNADMMNDARELRITAWLAPPVPPQIICQVVTAAVDAG